ncbi:MAG: DEAD/DEAH box helicase family protein [bacterium]|nr:DEAD/DEAH box helicase family protein [bacterium]
MNEAQTRKDLIDPALRDAGWEDAPAKVAVEQMVAPGRIEHDGRSHKPLFADYVLMYEGRRIAVVEAKSNEKSVDAGEAQARFYAEALGVRFAYSTNGVMVRSFDMVTGGTHDFTIEEFPNPVELVELLKRTDTETLLEKVCRQIPFLPKARYYQERAVEAVIKAFGNGKKNALITLATGTGKTFIAYQLVKKLVEAKWTRTSIGKRKPRILFLADRNILADQAKESFIFSQNECYRLDAGSDNPPLDRTVYFTLYQTLLGETESEAEVGEAIEREVKFKKFSPDFFDLVIIDECHRGGANDESTWRTVLDYFKSASHLGLTATPKCDVNGSTYAYFGEPVYTYSLKKGIADGFLTPYRVKVIDSTIRDYIPESGDVIERPEEVEIGHIYENDDLERRRIQIDDRDKHFVEELFKVMPRNQKALVFCVTQEHAARIVHLIREEAQKYGIYAPHYCERVTAEDGAIGEQYLKEFRNNENEVPTILTTSQKLSTGVDACNVRSIVLMKQVKSMVEFKQIVGRGTRLYDGKAYFTIYDFTGATEKFKDPSWDGEVTCGRCGKNPCECKSGGGKGPMPERTPCSVCGCIPCTCEKQGQQPNKVTLSSGRVIMAKWKEHVIFDNEMLSVTEFLNRFAVAVRKVTKTPELLKACWADMAKRKEFIEALELIGFNPNSLRDIQRNTGHEAYDILDVMLDIAYDVEPITRALRAEMAEKKFANLTGECQCLLKIMLENYVHDGVWTLTAESFRDLLMQRYTTLRGACSSTGFDSIKEVMDFYVALQKEIYAA